MNIFEIIKNINPADEKAVAGALRRQKDLIKPLGSLGTLEDIAVKIAGITGRIKNKADKRILFLFAADNGIYEEGVSGSPGELTRTLTEHYATGQKCAINVICSHFGTDLKIVDMGVIGEVAGNRDRVKLMPEGTRNFLKESAMPEDIAEKAMEIGASYAKYAVDNSYDIIGNGEVGMGNTTTAAACILASCGMESSHGFIGRGGGLSDNAFDKKRRVIDKALEIYGFNKNDPFKILSAVGGLDIAAMAGLYLGAAYYRIPIVIDGLISAAGALLAYRLQPLVKDFMIASHISQEPAYSLAIKEIGIEPMLALKMRLGEGSGCPFAFSVIEGALAAMNEMATFEELQVAAEYRKDIKMD